ncbi:hypothetical protein [Carboxylicivirga sp. N1Y90]|uniref:hypothetical protein n=1 Tax=Carboxylicivirga fragile TaxID=3417571 RepID=UPI003D34BA6E|nr:hypothetical protein [Marinilabiliaceae bacterium N1Y90]
MNELDIEVNKRRDFSDVINVTFKFIKQEFKPFFGTIATYSIIPIIGASVLAVFYTTDSFQLYFQGLVDNNSSIATPDFGMYGLMMLVSMLCYLIVMGISYEYLNLYNERGRGNFTGGDVASAFGKNFLSLIAYFIVVYIITIIASIFFIIPGIYLGIVLSLIFMVKTVENKGFSRNWSRCFELIKGNWWNTFGLLIILSIIVGVSSSIFTMPTMIYSFTKGITMAQGGEGEFDKKIMIVFSLISTFASYMIYSVIYLGIGFQYYSLAARDNSQSILERINKIGESDTNEVQ